MAKRAVLLCDLTDCVTVDFEAPAAYTAGDQVMVGDTPMIIAFSVAEGGKATGIVKAPMVELATSTNSSAGAANFSAGYGIFWSAADNAVMPGTGGDSTGTLVGICTESAAKTAGSVVGLFDAMLYLAVQNTKRE